MFCTGCGATLKEGAQFCTSCGALVSGRTAVSPTVDFVDAPAVPEAVARRRSSALVPMLVVGAVVLAVLGIAAYVAYSRGALDKTEQSVASKTASGTSSSAETSTAGASTASKSSGSGSAAPPSGSAVDLSRQAKLSASSTYKGYGVANLLDNKLDSAWAEGQRKEGDYGIGTTITFSFPSDVWVSHVRLIPGYVKFDPKNSVDRWYSNGRVSSAKLKFSDGTESQAFDLDTDAKTWQNMMLPSPVKTRSVTFVILGVAPANTYSDHDASDTTISEMRVFGLN